MNHIMRQILTLIFTTLLLASCDLTEVGGTQSSREDIWKNPTFSKDSTSRERVRCFITGLDYPDGYDWRADPEKGVVKCSLVVFCDGIPVMKVPVGKEYEVSPDPDMHRIIDGDLYTDYSTSDETVIKKNGKELFRYGGREMILGMTVSKGSIYTLGQPRNGEGFTYRKDGVPIIERRQGFAFPRLQSDQDSISFAFSEPIYSPEGNIERYYHVMNGKIVQAAIREDIKTVWDIILHENSICCLASLTGVSSPVLIRDGNMTAMETDQGTKILGCRLIPAGHSMGIEAICSNKLLYSSGIWMDGKKYRTFSSGMTVSGICAWNDGVCCVLNNGVSGRGVIFRCGDTFSVPTGYTMMGDNPIDMVNGILTIGLSSVTGGQPIIWKDGETQKLDINGPICTLSAVRM